MFYHEEGISLLRSQLIAKLVETHSHLPRPVVEAALNAILNAITTGLAHGHRVELRKFGNFTSKVQEARMASDPRTGEAVSVERKRILRFRAGGHILDRLNHPTTPG